MRIRLHTFLAYLQNAAFTAWLQDPSPRGTFTEWRLYYTFCLVGKLREAAYRLMRAS